MASIQNFDDKSLFGLTTKFQKIPITKQTWKQLLSAVGNLAARVLPTSVRVSFRAVLSWSLFSNQKRRVKQLYLLNYPNFPEMKD